MRRITSLTPLSHRLARLATGATRKVSACILLAALVAAGPLLSDSGTLEAQDPLSGCLKCRSFRLFDIEDLHWTTSGLLQEHGFGYGDGVHGSPEPGNCDVIHGICVNVPRFAARELTKTIAGHIPVNRNLLAATEAATAELLEPDA